MAQKRKFKVGQKVKYEMPFKKGYSEIFKVVSKKEFIKYDRKVSGGGKLSAENLVKAIDVTSRSSHKSPACFLKSTETEEYYTWMPENKLIPYGRAFKVLYENK